MTPDQLKALTKAATDSGKIIEAGWLGLRLAAIDPAAPEDQLREMRTAFFAGAQHLFSSIMTILDPGEEATEADLARMTLIHQELDEFIEKFKLGIRTEGSA